MTAIFSALPACSFKLEQRITSIFPDVGGVMTVGVAANDPRYGNDNGATYTYDAQHRQTSKKDGRDNKTMYFAYDAVGNLASKTDYQGDVTSYQYDGTNRLAGISSPAYQGMSYQYDAVGRLAAKIWSSGARITYEYDMDSRVVGLRQVSANGTVINDSDYLYDEIGNIKTETLAGGEYIDYTYDPVGRLLTANYSNPALQDITYTYDKVGNRKTAQLGTATVYYLYNNAGNRLDKVCSSLNAGQTDCATGAQINRYAYDTHGRRTDKYDAADVQVAHYNWNQRGLLTSDVTAGATTSYLYDANGYRIKKTNPDASINQYLLSGEHLESVYDGSGNLQASYQRGQFIDEIVSANVKANGRMVHQVYFQGMVGSVDAITDANGSVVQSTRYSPFGEQISQTGTAANAMLYAGREKDASSGLYYNRARYYDAGIGRFISEDPIGLNGGINLYAYVQNNPLIYSDPRGLMLTTGSVFSESFGEWNVYGYDFSFQLGYGEDRLADNGLTYGQMAHEGALMFWPGYEFGTCIYNSCSAFEWSTATIGMIPAGKSLSLGARTVVSGADEAFEVGARTVSRWMSPKEYDAMVDAQRVLPDSSGGKYILNETASDIPGAVNPGSVHAQFEIPANSSSVVTDPSKGWEYLYTDKTESPRI